MVDNPTPFFSAALRAAEKLPQNFGTAQQLQSMLLKYGAKASELDYIGVPAMLKQYSSRVPKAALVDYIDKNKVLPVEKKLGDKSINSIAFDDDAWHALAAESSYPGLERYSIEDRLQFLENSPGEAHDAINGTRYRDYATHPSDKYTEHLIKLPTPSIKTMDRDSYNKAVAANPAYQAPHFDEDSVNLLAHMRYDTGNSPSTYNIPDELNIKSPMFVDEMQSDWHQAGRKRGYAGQPRMTAAEWNAKKSEIIKQFGADSPEMEAHIRIAPVGDPVPNAPLKSTDAWSSMLVRRALYEAAAQGNDALAWTPGAVQSKRYMGQNPEGMAGYYDKILPSIVQKYIKPYGGTYHAPKMPDLNGNQGDDVLSQYVRDNTLPATPHIATLPNQLRDKLLEQGIPFFAHGGYIDG